MDFMHMYQNLFHPMFLILIFAIVVVIDWKNSRGSLSVRFLTIAVSWVVGFTIYRSYSIFMHDVLRWMEDLFAIIGLSTAILITLAVWKLRNFGREMIGAIIGAISVSIPYIVISPFWNISGHVAYTTGSIMYLMSFNRRFLALLPLSLIMVVNRPLVSDHTWGSEYRWFPPWSTGPDWSTILEKARC